MVDRRDDIALMGQRTGQPRLFTPITAVAVGEHDQWMFAAGGWCIGYGEGADEDCVVGDQLGLGGGGSGVPDDQFEWSVVLRIGQGGGLEADEVFGGEGGSGEANQEQGA